MQCPDASLNDSDRPTSPATHSDNSALSSLNVLVATSTDSQPDSSPVAGPCATDSSSIPPISPPFPPPPPPPSVPSAPAAPAVPAAPAAPAVPSAPPAPAPVPAPLPPPPPPPQPSAPTFTPAPAPVPAQAPLHPPFPASSHAELTAVASCSGSFGVSRQEVIKEVDESEQSHGNDTATSSDYLRYIAASSRRSSQDLINLPASPFSYHRALQARKNRVSFTAAPRYLPESAQSQISGPTLNLNPNSSTISNQTLNPNYVQTQNFSSSSQSSALNSTELTSRFQPRRGSKRSILNAGSEACPLLAEVKESSVEVMPHDSLSATTITKGDQHESQVCASPPNVANTEITGKHSRSPSFTSQTHFQRQQMARQSIGRLSFQYYYDSADAQRANQLHQRLLQSQTIFGAEEPKDGIGCIGWALYVLSFSVVIFTFPFSLYFCFKVVQEYERAVIFRLGRLIGGGAKGPGIFFVLPCIEAYTKVDLRTVSFDVPPQEVLTKDSVTVSVDAVIYYRVSNATIAVANVENAHHSTRSLAQTTLRNVLGTKNLSDLLVDRDTVSGSMHHILDEATEQWGITVERVEMKDVRLPVQMQRAMAAEAEASREARAKIIAAEGEMRAAKALKEAAVVISESPAALQLRYLQTLNSISSEKNSTIIFPLPIDILKHFVK